MWFILILRNDLKSTEVYLMITPVEKDNVRLRVDLLHQVRAKSQEWTLMELPGCFWHLHLG